MPPSPFPRPIRLVLGLLLVGVTVASPVAAELRAYDTPYYTIYTDLDEPTEKETAIRLTHMAEEYHNRTRDFAGVINQKFPFYLYQSPEDYYTAGGLPGTAGVFIYQGSEGKLMAVAGQKPTLNTWHTVQHEGFHQFAHAVIGGQLPTWLDEGLAEYFGEAIFTGDGFLTGVVPPWRLKRLKVEMQGRALKSVPEIMDVSPQQWQKEMSLGNYDQAWSMVHFLVHGDGGKYQQPFAACIREISGGKSFERAWLDTLGLADGFEERWKAYWLSQPVSPTKDLYSQAVVSILTSFLGRATAQKQTFASCDDFFSAALAKKLKISVDDWLPPALLAEAIDASEGLGRWELHAGANKQPALVLSTKEGSHFTGSFVLRGGRVTGVGVVNTRPARSGAAQSKDLAGK